MDDKVNVSIEQIENGYILRRSWTEKKDGEDGKICCDYKSEEHFFKELPEGFSRYMVKGKIGDEPPKDMDEADARADFILNRKDKEENKEAE
jgi:hypothetical protein